MSRYLTAAALFCLVACDCDGPDTPDDGGVDRSVDTFEDQPLQDQSARSCTDSECNQDELCAAGTCVPKGPECDTDADCAGDSYCCADGCAPSLDQAACIRYGTGPRGNVNDMCEGGVAPGVFRPVVQCEFNEAPPGDPFPEHLQVASLPLVMNLPTPARTEVVFVGMRSTTDAGVIRIIDGEDCTLLANVSDDQETITPFSAIALGDLDGDASPDIVAPISGGIMAFRWDSNTESYTRFWKSTEASAGWDGPSLHDLDDDGLPEVIVRGVVLSGLTGTRVTSQLADPFAPVIDVDGDGKVELLSSRGISEWNPMTTSWTPEYNVATQAVGMTHAAAADFGRGQNGTFLLDEEDGIAEMVLASTGRLEVVALDGSARFTALIDGGPTTDSGGGPPTIADFDGDGQPEIGVAGKGTYSVIDPECNTASDECAGGFVRWVAQVTENSSGVTGSSVFDFDGDGASEVVYRDECYVRIFDGSNGDVLFSSPSTSCTWHEYPVIADTDGDENTEIVVGSELAAGCMRTCPNIDPIHPGLTCRADEDCLSGQCTDGLCRCSQANECSTGFTCATPLAGGNNVCRATLTNDFQPGLKILRDGLDRWVSSRSVWNQHAYSVTNINDDGTVPSTSERATNHDLATLNNYRQNIQGARGLGELPDITGRLDRRACQIDGDRFLMTTTVCNRGKRAVGSRLPASFYKGSVSRSNLLCTTFTSDPVPLGECREVTCDLPSGQSLNPGDTVVVVVNDDGMGGRNTAECEYDNNSESVVIEACPDLI